jgi:hypothetical protein
MQETTLAEFTRAKIVLRATLATSSCLPESAQERSPCARAEAERPAVAVGRIPHEDFPVGAHFNAVALCVA